MTSAQEDLEGLANRLSSSGFNAAAPAMLVGRSGAKHNFALAVLSTQGKIKIIVEVALSMKEVEELQVLSFQAKVFDLNPEHALLCVSPKLGQAGKFIASEYNISVIESEVPRQLVSMVAEYVDQALRTRKSR